MTRRSPTRCERDANLPRAVAKTLAYRSSKVYSLSIDTVAPRRRYLYRVLILADVLMSPVAWNRE